MEGKHPNLRQTGSGRHGVSHRVRYVVEFEIEEDPKAKARELLNGSRALGCEELAADLE
jgi:hypothetical protein